MAIDRTRYPLTAAAFDRMGADDHVARILQMDTVWEGIRARVASGEQLPVPHLWNVVTDAEYTQAARSLSWQGDLVYAGSGLGLLHAYEMARRGWRVLIFDRTEVGCVHREWNISRSELQALVDGGGWTWAELDQVIMNEYRDGLVRFYRDREPVTLHLPEVLNIALDAGALLAMTRTKLAAVGAEIVDFCTLDAVTVSSDTQQPVLVRVRTAENTTRTYGARVVVDGMGTTSPLSLQRFGGRPYAGVCPTVGTVASGFVEGEAPTLHDRTVGDILLTVSDAQQTQQYMWEGFPGRGDELTVYLFYYDTLIPGKPLGRPSPTLLALFEEYFLHLESYKPSNGAVHHHKPVYGYIPARHSLQRTEAPLLRGVLPIGDAAGQQSPLTFCGFGSHVRNLRRTTGMLDTVLRSGLEQTDALALVSPFQVNVSLNWVFSRFMQPWGQTDADVNTLQHHFMGVLERHGTAFATRFFRDEMRWSDYHKMILGMFFAYLPIVGIAGRVLRLRTFDWIADYLRFTWAGALAAGARVVGMTMLERMAADLPIRWRLRLLAQIGEWRVMGWDR
jgi:lycopene cyclase CruA